MDVDDIMKLPVLNKKGETVLLGALVTTHWISGPMMSVRYNGYPTMRITGAAAPGHSSGDAMAEMERLAEQLPPGFGYEWSGQSREEKLAGSSAIYVYLFAVLAVFLLLAALYESWSIPLAVLLSVPLGLLGVAVGVWLRGMESDVYFQIGLVTIIGLSAKNAILIVEFAKDLQASGMTALDAAVHAARMRFRPILMTSFAFMLGVVPLYFATGASSAAQRAIGTGVLWGMLIGTVLAVFFVPTLFVLVRKIFPVSAVEQARAAAHAQEAGLTADPGH
jgi:multidrug efflux pump